MTLFWIILAGYVLVAVKAFFVIFRWQVEDHEAAGLASYADGVSFASIAAYSAALWPIGIPASWFATDNRREERRDQRGKASPSWSEHLIQRYRTEEEA